MLGGFPNDFTENRSRKLGDYLLPPMLPFLEITEDSLMGGMGKLVKECRFFLCGKGNLF